MHTLRSLMRDLKIVTNNLNFGVKRKKTIPGINRLDLLPSGVLDKIGKHAGLNPPKRFIGPLNRGMYPGINNERDLILRLKINRRKECTSILDQILNKFIPFERSTRSRRDFIQELNYPIFMGSKITILDQLTKHYNKLTEYGCFSYLSTTEPNFKTAFNAFKNGNDKSVTEFFWQLFKAHFNLF